MRSNITQLKNYKPGIRGSLTLKTNRKKFSSSLSGNYSMMLQLYCLNKKKTLTKKELKYSKLASGLRVKTKSWHSFSLTARVAAFFTINFALFRKVRQEVLLVTE